MIKIIIALVLFPIIFSLMFFTEIWIRNTEFFNETDIPKDFTIIAILDKNKPFSKENIGLIDLSSKDKVDYSSYSFEIPHGNYTFEYPDERTPGYNEAAIIESKSRKEGGAKIKLTYGTNNYNYVYKYTVKGNDIRPTYRRIFGLGSGFIAFPIALFLWIVTLQFLEKFVYSKIFQRQKTKKLRVKSLLFYNSHVNE